MGQRFHSLADQIWRHQPNSNHSANLQGPLSSPHYTANLPVPVATPARLDQALLQLPIQIARPSRQSWYQRASRTLAAPARPMQPKGGKGSRVLPNHRAPTRRPSSPKAPRRRNVTSPGFPSGAAFRGKQTRRSSSPHGRSGRTARH